MMSNSDLVPSRIASQYIQLQGKHNGIKPWQESKYNCKEVKWVNMLSTYEQVYAEDAS